MTNPEVPAGDNTQDDFSKFMAEFGELDQELDLQTADTADETQQVVYDNKMAEILRKIESRGVPRLAQVDKEHDSDTFHQYVDEWKATHDSEDEGELAVDAVVAYYDEREFQEIVLETATLLVCKLEDRNLWRSDALEVYAAKKDLQATFMVNYDRGPGDTWYELFDELVPTEGLDTLRPGDEQYIIEAEAKQMLYYNYRIKRQMILHYAFDVLEVKPETTSNAALEAITAVLIEMRIIAEAPIFTEAEYFERREQLEDLAATLYPDEDTLGDLLMLFETAYPAMLIPMYESDDDEDDEYKF